MIISSHSDVHMNKLVIPDKAKDQRQSLKPETVS